MINNYRKKPVVIRAVFMIDQLLLFVLRTVMYLFVSMGAIAILAVSQGYGDMKLTYDMKLSMIGLCIAVAILFWNRDINLDRFNRNKGM